MRRPTSRDAAAPAAADAAADAALRAVPSLLADDAGRRARRHVRAPRARGDRLRRGRPRRRAGARTSREAQARRRVDLGDPARVVAGLRAAIETPLGPLVGGAAAARRRARRPARRARLRAAARRRRRADRAARRSRRSPRVLREHLAGRTTRSPATPTRLADPALRHERARLPDRQHRPRAAAAPAGASRSSTTRRTGSRAPGEELTAWHHRPAALAAEMERAHYGAAGAALHRRAAPLPALAAAAATTPSATSPACSTCSCAG